MLTARGVFRHRRRYKKIGYRSNQQGELRCKAVIVEAVALGRGLDGFILSSPVGKVMKSGWL